MPNIILKLKSFTLNLFLDCAEADRFVTERMTSPRRDSEAATPTAKESARTSAQAWDADGTPLQRRPRCPVTPP